MMMNELKNSMHRGETAAAAADDDDDISVPVLPDAMTKLETMPKIPPFIRDKYNSEDYDPLIVSFGPYHHGQSRLKFVEDFKPTAVEWFVGKSERDETFWLNEVLEVIGYLRRSYIEGSTDKYSNDYFARMMLKDVCLVVMITRKPMENSSISKEFDNHLGRAASSGLIRDLYLLENQIPFWFFKRILYKRYGHSEGEKGWRKFWIKTNHGIVISDDNEGYIGEEDEDCAHFVEALKKTYVAGWKPEPEINKNESITEEVMPGRQGGTEEQWSTKTMTSNAITSWSGLREKHGYIKDYNKDYYAPRSVTELKAKGIYIEPNSNDSYKNITFHDSLLYATLRLPVDWIHENKKAIFSNMIVYEMIPDDRPLDFTITAYIHFMKTLLQMPEDAEELQNKGVIINMMGNDQDVLDAYNEIYTFRISCTTEFRRVCKSIQEHYNNKTRTWLAQFLHTYFHSPWSVITLFASILIIFLTFIQAYYTVYPKGDNNKH